MDCSICFEAITKQTGSTTLSCEHAFHFRCIVNWFDKQIMDDLEQTCPCCRGKGQDMDRCEIQALEEEEDDDETYEDEESETASEADEEDRDVDGRAWWDGDLSADFRWERTGAGQWLITSNRQMAFDSLQALFGPLNQLEAVETPEEIAAKKIQAIFRGYQDRKVYQGVRSLLRLNPEAYLMI